MIAGDWPSSVPARARLGVRVGFPRRWTPAEAFDRVRSAVLGAAADDPWLAAPPPRRMVMGSTTDARYYLNQFGVPAVAYGPRSRNIHGTDEAVELASIVSGARVLARFMAGFFAASAVERSGR